ncbi:hypothetical protein IAG41_15055 [Sphingomonas sp. JC676]|uniref:hypothetical protein n=1 Tax=Sphingomonas sp. JC676 TaxID=2768065 RepID=UPI0016581956|nr:hypothetical protein [Sphingomonas sp. JC676]MBC9033712.1 hypothetical protein [Sphingomonas sp. JC676]
MRDILVEILAGAAGGTREEWAAVVGEIEKLPLPVIVGSNWMINPKGTNSQLETVRAAELIVRAEHPFVAH